MEELNINNMLNREEDFNKIKEILLKMQMIQMMQVYLIYKFQIVYFPVGFFCWSRPS